MNKKKALEIWKDYRIDHAHVEYTCGGDSFGDAWCTYYNKSGQELDVDNDELEEYVIDIALEDEYFRNASDGHYIGEFGYIIVEVEDDEFVKSGRVATSQYQDTNTDVVELEPTPEEHNLFKIIDTFDIHSRNEPMNIEYKEDCIIDDSLIRTLNTLTEKIVDMSFDHECEVKGDEDTDIEFDISVGYKNEQIQVELTYTTISNVENENDSY